MRNLHLSAFFLLFLLLASCHSNASQQEMRFATLTYNQMYTTVFGQSDGEGVEWHGEGLDISAIADLSIVQALDCGSAQCGKLVQLKNQGAQSIEATVQSTFSIPDFPPYTATKLIIAPKATATVGCSKLCLDGQEVVFSPKIVGATYVSN